MSSPRFRCHDLLALSPQACEQLALEAPDWVASALAQAPWGVVRRAAAGSGRIPVGVRGAGRGQRHAAWVTPAQVLSCVTPAELMPLWCRPRTVGSAPALLRARLGAPLAAVFSTFDGSQTGPGGSWGFELLTGRSCTQDRSDLDLVLRLQALPSPVQGRQWLQALEQAAAPVRVDALMELPFGGMALAEWAALTADDLEPPSGRQVMLRRADGPQLVHAADLAARRAPRAEGAT